VPVIGSCIPLLAARWAGRMSLSDHRDDASCRSFQDRPWGTYAAENGRSSQREQRRQRGIAYLIAPIQSGRDMLVFWRSALEYDRRRAADKRNRKNSSAIARGGSLGPTPLAISNSDPRTAGSFGATSPTLRSSGDGLECVEPPRSGMRAGKSEIGALPPFTGTRSKDPLPPTAAIRTPRK
jgi:hypothetical protein